MSITLMIYLASIVNDIKAMFDVLCVALIIVTVLLGCFAGYCLDMEYEDRYTSTIKSIKRVVISAILCATTSVLIPSEKTIYLMTAASIAEDIAKKPATVQMLDKVYNIVDKKLDEQLESLTKKVDDTKEKKQ